jgi:hypothetical protein
LKNGFTPDNTRWVHHGKAHRMRGGGETMHRGF